MVNSQAIEQISESLKTVSHSKLGRYFVTVRAGVFMVLPIEARRPNEISFDIVEEIDLICGIPPNHWWVISDNISNQEEYCL